MINERKILISQLFHFLAGKDYLWLKAITENPVETPVKSDIDLFVKAGDLPDVLQFVADQPNIVHSDLDKGFNAVYLSLFFADGTYLKLDLLTKLVRKQWLYLDEDYLFTCRIWKKGIATYNSEILLEHVLLFNFLNHSGLPKKYIGYFSSMPSEEVALMISFINGKYETDFESIDDLSQFDPKVRTALIRFLKKNRKNARLSRLQAGIDFLQSKTKNWKPIKGQVITFSGVDGAGKTTLLNDLKNVLSNHLQRKVVVLRHRPSVLPILSAWTKGKAAAEQKAATTLPRQGQNRSTMGSLLRFGYYYFDYLFGQAYVWLRFTLPGYTVIYDRYYFDFIIDGKRSNISLGEKLPKWLYRFVAKPQLNIFLYASPAVILERKQELPAADIEQMTVRYRALFTELAERYQGKYLCLENIDRPQSLRTILAHLMGEPAKEKTLEIA